MRLINAHLTRQQDTLPSMYLNEQITVIGAGAIGSVTVMALAKMGFSNITVYDFDTIEEVNLSNQFYRFSDVGKPKVMALKEIVKDFTCVEITAKNEKYVSGMFSGIVIAAVDSMAVRKLLWENHKRFSIGTRLFIDPRMAIEFSLIYAMNPMSNKDIDSYEKTLYSDENAVQERCTNKAIMYTSYLIAGQVSKIVKDFVTESVPYSRVTQWNIAQNFMQTYKKE